MGYGVPNLTDLFAEQRKAQGVLESANIVFGDPNNTNNPSLTITGLNGSITYYIAPVRKTPLAKIVWTWNALPAVDADDVTADPIIDYMFGVTQSASGDPVSYRSTNGNNTITTDGHQLNTVVTAKVYAVTLNGLRGPVASATAAVAVDTTAPNTPSTPAVVPGMKSVVATWDGLDSGGAGMPADLDYIEVHSSITLGFTPASSTLNGKLYGPGKMIILSDNSYSTIYVKFIAVDTFGNKSPASAQGSATPTKAVNTDLGVVLPGDIGFTDADNLLLDGSFENALLRATRLTTAVGTWVFDNGAGVADHGSYALRVDPAASPAAKSIELQSGNTQLAEITVIPNSKIYVSGKIKGTVGVNGTAGISVRWRSQTDVITTTNLLSDLAPDGTWHFKEATAIVPSDAVTMQVFARADNNTVGTWYIDSVQVRRVIGTQLIEDAAITNAKIGALAVNDAKIADLSVSKLTTAFLTAGQSIKAGDPNANYAELSSTGFRAYSPDPETLLPTERIRIATNSDDVIELTNALGQSVASISDAGLVRGEQASFGNDGPVYAVGPEGENYLSSGVTVYGREYEDRLGDMSGGIVASSFTANFQVTGITTTFGLGEISYDQQPGRNYRLTVNHANVTQTVAGDRFVYTYRYTSDGTAPSITSAVFDRQILPFTGTTTYTPPPFVSQRTFGSTTTVQTIRILVCLERLSGTGSIQVSTNVPTNGFKAYHMWVEDIGRDMSDTFLNNQGNGSIGGGAAQPPPSQPKKSYTTTYTSIDSASYRGSGVKRTDTSYVYQGSSSAGSINGDQRGLWIMPGSLFTYLNNVNFTIDHIYCWIYANHWWYNSGGTAIIKVHAHTAAPASSPTMSTAVTVPNWPNPGAKWIRLPTSLYAGFKAGTWRSIGVGPSGGTNLLYYGSFNSTAYIKVIGRM